MNHVDPFAPGDSPLHPSASPNAYRQVPLDYSATVKGVSLDELITPYEREHDIPLAPAELASRRELVTESGDDAVVTMRDPGGMWAWSSTEDGEHGWQRIDTDPSDQTPTEAITPEQVRNLTVEQLRTPAETDADIELDDDELEARRAAAHAALGEDDILVTVEDQTGAWWHWQWPLTDGEHLGWIAAEDPRDDVEPEPEPTAKPQPKAKTAKGKAKTAASDESVDDELAAALARMDAAGD